MLELVPDANPETAVRALRDMAADAEDRRNNSVGTSAKQQFGVWAERTERRLSRDFGIAPTLAFIQTNRYSFIRILSPTAKETQGTVHAELTSQESRLKRLADELEARIKIFKAAAGQIVVPDTTAVLRMNPLPLLDLTGITGGKPARLVLPLRVVEELDAKKYGENERFRTIVRKLLCGFRRFRTRSPEFSYTPESEAAERPTLSRVQPLSITSFA